MWGSHPCLLYGSSQRRHPMRVVLVLIIPSCLHLGPLQLALIYHSLSTVTKINNKTTKKDVYEMGGGSTWGKWTMHYTVRWEYDLAPYMMKPSHTTHKQYFFRTLFIVKVYDYTPPPPALKLQNRVLLIKCTFETANSFSIIVFRSEYLLNLLTIRGKDC